MFFNQNLAFLKQYCHSSLSITLENILKFLVSFKQGQHYDKSFFMSNKILKTSFCILYWGQWNTKKDIFWWEFCISELIFWFPTKFYIRKHIWVVHWGNYQKSSKYLPNWSNILESILTKRKLLNMIKWKSIWQKWCN